jgi:hypothetical protein
MFVTIFVAVKGKRMNYTPIFSLEGMLKNSEAQIYINHDKRSWHKFLFHKSFALNLLHLN